MNCSSLIHGLVFCILCCRSMAPPAPVTNFALKSILEKDKLNGTNFTTWYRNLRIVLKHDKKENVLEEPLPEEPADNATAAAKKPIRNSRMSLLRSAASCWLQWS